METGKGESHDLCVSCGICCDGALFDYAKVLPDEEEHVRGLGLPMDERDGTPVFLLPCGNLCGAVCQIYEPRPTTCRTYKCTTLESLNAGEIDRAEADRRVAIGRATVAKVRTQMLPGETFLQLRRRFGADPSPGMGLIMLQWDTVMDRFFRKPHQRVLTPAPEEQEPIASPAVSPEPCTVSTTTRAGGVSRPGSPRSRSTRVSRRA